MGKIENTSNSLQYRVLVFFRFAYFLSLFLDDSITEQSETRARKDQQDGGKERRQTISTSVPTEREGNVALLEPRCSTRNSTREIEKAGVAFGRCTFRLGPAKCPWAPG